MATKKPAKLAINKNKSAFEKRCPKCDGKMAPVKFVRHTNPTGMFWLCDAPKCNHEIPT